MDIDPASPAVARGPLHRLPPRQPAARCRGLAVWALAMALLGSAGLAGAMPPPQAEAELREGVRLYERGQMAAAQRIFERLAEAGLPAAHYDLAVMHLRGELPFASPRQALRWMRMAADGGFVTAQYGLGELLEGGGGVRRDLAESQRWYERAAQGGSTEAQIAAATNLYLGRGVPRDASAAARWYEQAALAGDVGAQFLLAAMYEKGDDGFAADLRKARRWYEAAAQSGDPAARIKLRSLPQPGADLADPPAR